MALPLQHGLLEGAQERGDIWRLLTNIVEVVNELQIDHATFKASNDDIIAKLQGNYVTGVAALAIGSTPANVATAAFDYMIGGKKYTKAAVAAGTAPGNDVVPTGTFGAVALDINAAGTITAIEAPANATGYASAALAVAALPAATTGLARIGWVTATKSDGAFTFGTTALDAANSTVAYTDAPTLANSITLAAPATLTASTALTLQKG